MRSEKREDLFPAWGVAAALSRLRGRHKKFVASPMERKRAMREGRSWSNACIAAVNKIRYRHRAVFREAREPDAWAWVITLQKKKLARRIDPVSAWADAEYKILERYRDRLRESRWDRDADRWRYVIKRQQSYLARLRKRPVPLLVREGWESAACRLGQLASKRDEESKRHGSWAWRTTVASQREKIRNFSRQRGWKNCLLRNHTHANIC